MSRIQDKLGCDMTGLTHDLCANAGTRDMGSMCSNTYGGIRYFIVETIRRAAQHIIQSAVTIYAGNFPFAVTR
jgi:hypothetical protein